MRISGVRAGIRATSVRTIATINSVAAIATSNGAVVLVVQTGTAMQVLIQARRPLLRKAKFPVTPQRQPLRLLRRLKHGMRVPIAEIVRTIAIRTAAITAVVRSARAASPAAARLLATNPVKAAAIARVRVAARIEARTVVAVQEMADAAKSIAVSRK